MKIRVLSDLHLEFGDFISVGQDVDLIILAGDIHVGEKGILWALKNFDIPTLYILGNHEYYKHSYPKLLHKLKLISQDTNVHVLENKIFTMNNVSFFGTTLWSDFNLFGDPVIAGMECQQRMNDYRLIRRDPSYSAMRSIDTNKINSESSIWLKTSLQENLSTYKVVITHHAPSMKSIPEEFRSDLISAAYASNYDDFILEAQPDYWFHGHIHVPVDYTIGKTRVMANPKGYPDQKGRGFNPDLVIEIPD
jgi:Icc-related predicted phosphoesterase